MSYAQILLESAWTASIIPLSSEPTFFAMKSFGGFNLPLAAALSIIGASAGQLFNWWLGTILLRDKNRGKFKINEAWYEKISRLFNRYGVWFLFFSWLPLCNMLVVIAAFLHAKPKIALTLIIIGQVVHYGWYLLP